MRIEEIIKIKNENNKYSDWVIDYKEEYKDKLYYCISLSSNRSIISHISKDKIFWEKDIMYSDIIKPIKETFKFAFAAFRSINID